MNWPVPTYSRNQINKAGKTLLNLNKFDLNNYNSEDFDAVRHAYKIFSNWRSSHSYPINTFQSTLRNKLNRIDSNAIVAQRLKRMSSIIKKLRRFKNMKLAQMQDIGGLRTVVSSMNKVRMLQDGYINSQFKHDLVTIRDYISYPKESGYRSVHLIYRYKNDRRPEYNGLSLELQIRTPIQHAFATTVETIDTFLGSALKSSEGPKVWLDFFCLIGSAFAHLENTPPVPNYEGMTRKETFAGVVQKMNELNVRDRLHALIIATEQVYKVGKTGSYNLIILNERLKSVTVRTYSKDDVESAYQDYISAERKIKEGELFQVVLVSAGSIKNLRRAYPNYFLDTREFLKQLNRIERLSKLK